MDVPAHLATGMSVTEIDISNGLGDVTIDKGDQYDFNQEDYTDGNSKEDYFEYEEQEVRYDDPKGGCNEHDEESLDSISDSASEDNQAEKKIEINGLTDIVNIDVKKINVSEVGRYDFIDLDVAYQFYCWFARMNGFSVRKGQVLRQRGVVVQQTFLCSRQGYREDRGLTPETRTRLPKNETRCGCRAHFRVHIDINTQRWYVSVFNFDHNHALLEDKYCALLPAHRKMSKADIMQIDNFRKVGIAPPQMYGAFAGISGGYGNIGFIKKDIYNQIGKQRRQLASDASGAIKYLKDLAIKDRHMFIRHTVDAEGRLKHLFWCDGDSRSSYKVFGDVLAFDATYKKNKYMCPFVVFSGVNHHNQTIVFATALVSNETEESYVWLLEQFLNAMEGKAPVSVITDGDVAMKNAINRVFPMVHHRLCAWHLLRNAMTNVGVPQFMPYLKKCMLGDYEVGKFEQLWDDMVAKFGLENNSWISDLYEKRKLWSTAHIRGNFFAGIRTTSRCEGLHSHIGKFVHSRINLTEFVQQFQRCLTYFRFREVEADFQSEYGQAVLQTGLRFLERSASRMFTKDIFFLFRKVLKKAVLINVIGRQEMAMYSIFSVSKYRAPSSVWQVCYCPSMVEVRCSCLRMESIGLPCEHIVAVLVYLDISDLPKCVILNRWTKSARDGIRANNDNGSFYWASQSVARYATLVHLSKEVSELAHRDVEEYNLLVEYLANELNRLKCKYAPVDNMNSEPHTQYETLRDPPVVRSKGCGRTTSTTRGRPRQTQTCSTCGATGHNRRCCPSMREGGNGGKGRHDGLSDTAHNSRLFQQSQTFVGESSQVQSDADLHAP